jgi:NOL1/NOP2/fmu family ribosome biogenesis protein
MCIEDFGMYGYQPLIMPNEANHIQIEGVSAWRFLPHQSMGEGFFCCVLQKSMHASAGRVKLANEPFWQPLHKRDWSSLIPFVKDDNIQRYWQNGKGEVFYTQIQPEDVLPVAKMVQIGVQVGVLNKQVFTPHQGLILGGNANLEIPRLAIENGDALRILRGEDLRIEDSSLSGWHIVQWIGFDLAWVKMVRGRVSNHYPKEWRIRFL